MILEGWREVVEMDNITAAEILSSVALSLANMSLAPGDLRTLAAKVYNLRHHHLNDLLQAQTHAQAVNLAQVSDPSKSFLVTLILSRHVIRTTVQASSRVSHHH